MMTSQASNTSRAGTVVIRADASPTMGYGHVMRCLALAAAWRRAGGRTVFVSHELPPELSVRIKAAGHEVVALSTRHDDPLDWFTTATVARRTGADWLVLDGYFLDQRYQRWAHNDAWRVLVMDDTADLPHYEADLIVNQNHGAEELEYNTSAGCICCQGSDYVLLRPEFLSCAPRSDAGCEGDARKILVSLGGSELTVALLLVMKALVAAQYPDLQVTVAMPPGAAGLADARRLAEGSPLQVQVMAGADDWPEIMSRADLAISAAGSTAWELAYLGVPAALISVAPNQIGIAAAMVRAGAAVDLGPLSILKPAQLSKQLSALIADPNHRLALTRAGRRLVDGRGVDRVVAGMLDLIRDPILDIVPAPAAQEEAVQDEAVQEEEVLT